MFMYVTINFMNLTYYFQHIFPVSADVGRRRRRGADVVRARGLPRAALPTAARRS